MLALTTYNNTAPYAVSDGVPDTPIGMAGVDGTLMDCLNQTIGLAAPLVDGARGLRLGDGYGYGYMGSGWFGIWVGWGVWWALSGVL